MVGSSSQVRLAVCGAHGTGKSALIADAATTEPGVQSIGKGLVRSLLSEGYSFGRETDVRTMLAYLSRQFAQEESAAASGASLVLSDRTLLDMVGYVAANQATAGCRRWTDTEVAALRAIAQRALSYFDAVIYVPIEIEMEPDGVRPDGDSYHRMVDRCIRSAAEASPSTVVEVSGEPARRTMQLLTAYWRIRNEKAPAADRS